MTCKKITLKFQVNIITHFVIATAISYTGKRRSLNKYLPISVRAAAESIASLPTLFLSKYGVASLPLKNKNNYIQFIKSH